MGVVWSNDDWDGVAEVKVGKVHVAGVGSQGCDKVGVLTWKVRRDGADRCEAVCGVGGGFGEGGAEEDEGVAGGE